MMEQAETPAEVATHRPRLGGAGFARLLGVSQQAVSQAVAAGRVVSCYRDTAGRIWITDVEQAKVEWEANATKPTKTGGRRATVAGADASLTEMQRRVAIQRERKLKFENVLKRGQYLRVGDVKREAFDSARVIREGLLNLPARLASQLAAESDQSKVFAMLDEEIRAALTSLADALEGAAS